MSNVMCSANWELILEYLKVLLSWPPMAFAMVVLLVLIFRNAIENFIQRLTEGDIFGQKFKAVPPQPPIIEHYSGTEQLSEKEELNSKSSVQSSNTSEELPPELLGDPNAESAIEYVKRNPIQIVVDYKRLVAFYNHERAFLRIYGSQIRLLEYLATNPENWVPLTQLALFHLEHQRLAGRNDYQLNPYVNFLVGSGFLTVSSANSENVYKITQQGVEFLSYIKANYPAEWNTRSF